MLGAFVSTGYGALARFRCALFLPYIQMSKFKWLYFPLHLQLSASSHYSVLTYTIAQAIAFTFTSMRHKLFPHRILLPHLLHYFLSAQCFLVSSPCAKLILLILILTCLRTIFTLSRRTHFVSFFTLCYKYHWILCTRISFPFIYADTFTTLFLLLLIKQFLYLSHVRAIYLWYINCVKMQAWCRPWDLGNIEHTRNCPPTCNWNVAV